MFEVFEVFKVFEVFCLVVAFPDDTRPLGGVALPHVILMIYMLQKISCCSAVSTARCAQKASCGPEPLWVGRSILDRVFVYMHRYLVKACRPARCFNDGGVKV